MSLRIDKYRQLIEVENRRVTERLTILTQFEGLLFTSLALGWDKAPMLTVILSAAGLISAVAIGRALYNAETGISKLYREYIMLPEKEREDSGPVIGNFSLAQDESVPRKIRILLTPALILPALIGVVWLMILSSRMFVMIASIHFCT